MKQTKYLPPMTRAEWEALPECVKHFVSWEDARQGKVITLPDPKNLSAAVEYFTRPPSLEARKG